MKIGDEVLTRLAFCVHSGHFHSSMDNMAMDGASNVNVPPWRIGNLHAKGAKTREKGQSKEGARRKGRRERGNEERITLRIKDH